MGAELLIFCTWLTGVLKVIFLYMLNVGTNIAVIKFFLGNVLLLGLIVYLTPSKRDNTVYEWFKKQIANFNKKGEESNDEANEETK